MATPMDITSPSLILILSLPEAARRILNTAVYLPSEKLPVPSKPRLSSQSLVSNTQPSSAFARPDSNSTDLRSMNPSLNLESASGLLDAHELLAYAAYRRTSSMPLYAGSASSSFFAGASGMVLKSLWQVMKQPYLPNAGSALLSWMDILSGVLPLLFQPVPFESQLNLR